MCASVFARAKTDTRCPHWKDPRYLRGAYIMNHKKLLLTLTLCLCMLLGAVSLASAEEDGATGSGAETGGNTGHSHALCYGTTTCTDPAHSEENHGSVTFEKAITMADNVLCIDGVKQTPNSNSSDNYEYTLSEGTYYLDDNLTLNKGIQVQGNVTLCLNGHEIRSEGSYVIQTPWSGTVTFTLCDCKARGKIAHRVNSSSNSGGVNFTGSLLLYPESDNLSYRWICDRFCRRRRCASAGCFHNCGVLPGKQGNCNIHGHDRIQRCELHHSDTGRLHYKDCRNQCSENDPASQYGSDIHRNPSCTVR